MLDHLGFANGSIDKGSVDPDGELFDQGMDTFGQQLQTLLQILLKIVKDTGTFPQDVGSDLDEESTRERYRPIHDIGVVNHGKLLFLMNHSLSALLLLLGRTGGGGCGKDPIMRLVLVLEVVGFIHE